MLVHVRQNPGRGLVLYGPGAVLNGVFPHRHTAITICDIFFPRKGVPGVDFALLFPETPRILYCGTRPLQRAPLPVPLCRRPFTRPFPPFALRPRRGLSDPEARRTTSGASGCRGGLQRELRSQPLSPCRGPSCRSPVHVFACSCAPPPTAVPAPIHSKVWLPSRARSASVKYKSD